MGLPLTKIYSIQPFKVKSSLPFRHRRLLYSKGTDIRWPALRPNAGVSRYAFISNSDFYYDGKARDSVENTLSSRTAVSCPIRHGEFRSQRIARGVLRVSDRLDYIVQHEGWIEDSLQFAAGSGKTWTGGGSLLTLPYQQGTLQNDSKSKDRRC